MCSDSDIWRAMARVSLPVASRPEQFVFAGGEAEGAAEQVEPLGGGCLLDRDDDRRAAVGGRALLVAGREPGGPQGEPEAASQMRAGVRRVGVDAFLGGQELGGHVVDAGRDGLLVGLGRKQHVQPGSRSRRAAGDPKVRRRVSARPARRRAGAQPLAQRTFVPGNVAARWPAARREWRGTRRRWRRTVRGCRRATGRENPSSRTGPRRRPRPRRRFRIGSSPRARQGFVLGRRRPPHSAARPAGPAAAGRSSD